MPYFGFIISCPSEPLVLGFSAVMTDRTAHHLMAVWKQGTAVVYNRPVIQRNWRTHILWEPKGRGPFGWTVPGWDRAHGEMGWIYMLSLC